MSKCVRVPADFEKVFNAVSLHQVDAVQLPASTRQFDQAAFQFRDSPFRWTHAVRPGSRPSGSFSRRCLIPGAFQIGARSALTLARKQSCLLRLVSGSMGRLCGRCRESCFWGPSIAATTARSFERKPAHGTSVMPLPQIGTSWRHHLRGRREASLQKAYQLQDTTSGRERNSQALCRELETQMKNSFWAKKARIWIDARQLRKTSCSNWISSSKDFLRGASAAFGGSTICSRVPQLRSFGSNTQSAGSTQTRFCGPASPPSSTSCTFISRTCGAHGCAVLWRPAIVTLRWRDHSRR